MAVVTADNHGPLLNVAMWIVLVPMIIIALTKMYTKYDTLRKIQMDDYLGLIAMVCRNSAFSFWFLSVFFPYLGLTTLLNISCRR